MRLSFEREILCLFLLMNLITGFILCVEICMDLVCYVHLRNSSYSYNTIIKTVDEHIINGYFFKGDRYIKC